MSFYAPAWGISWLGSWGDSWGPLHQVAEHRPRTNPNVKLRKIREGYVLLPSVSAKARTGQVIARGHVAQVVEELVVRAGAALVWGQRSRARCRQVIARGRSRCSISGAAAGARVGSVALCGQARGRLESVSRKARGTAAVAAGRAKATAVWTEGCEGFVGDVSARGFVNPSDEQLALIALKLLGY